MGVTVKTSTNVEDGDMRRVAKATGVTVQTSTNGIYDGVLGTCADFEETRVEDERFNIQQPYVDDGPAWRVGAVKCRERAEHP